MQKQTSLNKRVGLMGGTFNPIHNGHLVLAQCALEHFKLDEVVFIPSGISWLKQGENIAESHLRISMTGMAIENNPNFGMSTIEVDRGGNSYSYETIQELKKRNPSYEYFFILGADSLLNIESWYHPELLMKECTLLASVRDDCDMERLLNQINHLKEKYQAKIEVLPMPHIEISSSKIRQFRSEGRSIRYMLPEPVRIFIEKNHLYENEQ